MLSVEPVGTGTSDERLREKEKKKANVDTERNEAERQLSHTNETFQRCKPARKAFRHHLTNETGI